MNPTSPLAGAESVLRAMAARKELFPTDRVLLAIRRDGLTYCLVKWTWTLREFPIWEESEEAPEADSDGVPSSERQREILAALLEKPLKVAALALALDCSPGRLYDRDGVRDLARMDLIRLGPDGYALTPKGRRVAEQIAEAE